MKANEHGSSGRDSSAEALTEIVAKLIVVGWICLILSAALLFVSSSYTGSGEQGSEVTEVLWLTAARLVGIVSFLVGLVAIFNRRWGHGTVMLAGSIGLPVVSVLVHGTL